MDNINEMNQEQRILRAAEKLFLEKGFAATSTTMIAKKAECNQALVHYYFRTKEKLFYLIFLDKFQLFLKSLKNKSTNGDFYARLREQMERHFDVLRENPQMPHLLISELFVNKDRRQMIIDFIATNPDLVEFRNNFEDALNEEIAKGTVRPISLIDLMMNIGSLNVMTFLSLPLFTDYNNLTPQQQEEFIAQRKQEIWNTIYNSLRN